jgi:hypothetical protein
VPALSFASSVCPICVWPPERGVKDIKGRGQGWHHAHRAVLLQHGLEWTWFCPRVIKATPSIKGLPAKKE